MKKISILSVLLAIVLAFSGCGKSDHIEKIDENAARSIALDALAVGGADIHIAPVELCERNGVSYYDVKITVGGQIHQFAVDAVTGVIIEQIGNSSDQSGETTDALSQAGSATGCLSEADVIEVAIKHAGYTPAHVQVESCYYHSGNSENVLLGHEAYYSITFFNAYGTYYQYVIGAQSGEVLMYDVSPGSGAPSTPPSTQRPQPREEKEIDPEMNVYPPSVAGYEDILDEFKEQIASMLKEAEECREKLTAEQAMQLGLEQIPGASVSDVTQMIATEYGYYVTVVYQNMKYKFAIDAYSGAFRSWYAESIG